ncbi:MAG: Mrp/NBP35 family ATP-binding protein [Saprospiraceae bacterium]|nr:Mrp/NBP35 family ATP-binding protein [Saprospiraceae bacterium]
MEKKLILDALAKVMDPNTGKDILSMHMVEALQIEGDSISFNLVLPNLNSEHKQAMNFACMEAVQQVYPNAAVHVHMLSQNPQATSEKESALSQVKNIICVASGKGGVGKSTVAVNLALGLKELGARVGLIDADVYGPSIPTMLGLQGQRPVIREVYGKAKIQPLMAYGLAVMSMGFIVDPEQAVVLRGPRLGGVITQFFKEVLWEPLDFLIVDLPPGTGDVQLSLVQTVPVTGAVMVTTPQDVALADALKAMNMFLLPSVNVPILGVVENMSWFTPAELPDNKYYLFGKDGGKKLVKESNSMLLGQIPIVQGIRESGDAGKPIVLTEGHPSRESFLEVARNVMRQTAIRNEMQAPTQIVDVN